MCFIKLRMNSSAFSSVWFLFPCSCVCFSSSVCVLCVCVCFRVAACVSLLQCVCGRVSGCMSDRTAPRVTVLPHLSAPASTKTTHSASCSSPGLKREREKEREREGERESSEKKVCISFRHTNKHFHITHCKFHSMQH